MTTTDEARALADKLERPFPWRDDMIRAAAALRDLTTALAAAEADAAAARQRVRELEAAGKRLLSAVAEVQRHGASTGPQWTRLTVAELHAREKFRLRAALARQKAPDA